LTNLIGKKLQLEILANLYKKISKLQLSHNFYEKSFGASKNIYGEQHENNIKAKNNYIESLETLK